MAAACTTMLLEPAAINVASTTKQWQPEKRGEADAEVEEDETDAAELCDDTGADAADDDAEDVSATTVGASYANFNLACIDNLGAICFASASSFDSATILIFGAADNLSSALPPAPDAPTRREG